MRVRKSLVVESCAHGLDTRGAYQVAGCSKALTFRACNSGAVAFAHCSSWFSLGIGFQVGASIMELQAGGGTPKSSSLDQFQGNHPRASLGYCGIFKEDRVDSELGNGLDSGMLLVPVPFCFLAESTAD
jgi:hypothetical protein